jgi:hypothetical protein
MSLVRWLSASASVMRSTGSSALLSSFIWFVDQDGAPAPQSSSFWLGVELTKRLVHVVERGCADREDVGGLPRERHSLELPRSIVGSSIRRDCRRWGSVCRGVRVESVILI